MLTDVSEYVLSIIYKWIRCRLPKIKNKIIVVHCFDVHCERNYFCIDCIEKV